jgi:hypothetical protein
VITFDDVSQLIQSDKAMFIDCSSREVIHVLKTTRWLKRNWFVDCSRSNSVVFESGSNIENIQVNTFVPCICRMYTSIPEVALLPVSLAVLSNDILRDLPFILWLTFETMIESESNQRTGMMKLFMSWINFCPRVCWSSASELGSHHWHSNLDQHGERFTVWRLPIVSCVTDLNAHIVAWSWWISLRQLIDSSEFDQME